jgi:hypothetical protein
MVLQSNGCHLAAQTGEGEGIVFVVLVHFFKLLSQCERMTVVVLESNGYVVGEWRL